MARSKGSANFAGSLEVLAGAPLDARTVVNVKADLTDSQSYTYVYVGMIVSVKSEGKAYILTAADFTDSNNWSELGSGGSGGGVVEGYFNPTDNLFYEENTYETAITGESGMLYVSLDTNRLYRFNGTIFIVVSDLDATVYQPAGSVLFANLPAASAGTLGFVYDIQDDFVTTSDFIEGAGKEYSAGTNVVVINHGTSSIPIYKYDVLSSRVNLPTGGTTGQALVKHSNADDDVEWKTIAEGQGYTENPVASSNPSYNNESLVSDGQTRFFHTVVGAGESMSLTNLPIVDNTVGRHYYTEMTKASDGLSFTQRLRVFYTKNSVDCVSIFERRCYSDGTTWTYVDWVEITVDGIPTGGTTGQALVKASNTDKDVTWGSMPDAYTPDDTAFTDIADGDYIPVYDTSATTKKKSLWSNIVDVLKNTFQQKLTAGNNIGINNNVITATNAISLKFSTTEQEVGTWIDGSKVYQKTIAITLPSTSVDGTVANNLYSIGSNVKYLVYMWGSFTTSANNCVPIEHCISVTMISSNPKMVGSYAGVRLNNYSTSSEKNKLSISNSNSNWNGCQGYVTLIYTKA